MERIARGDKSAVGECLAKYGGIVWSLARRLSRDHADAEDAAQEIFLDLWKSASRFDPAAGSEVAFIAMVARRRLIDRQRKRSRAPHTEPLQESEVARSLPSGGDLPHAEICAEATLAARAIAELRPEQQKVLSLAICQGLSHEEIASSTGMPLGTVKAYARRGLLRVREMLNEAGTRANREEVEP